MRFTSASLEDVQLGEFSNKGISLEFTQFQIPRMYMPFGVSGFTPPYGPVKYNVDFAMKGWNEEGNYVKKFYEFLKELENKVIVHITQRSQKIFGSQMSLEQVTEHFNSNIKESSGGYEPKFRVKIDDKVKVFDIGDKDITEELQEGLYKRHSGAAIVELGNVYFMNKKFGLVWKMVQIKVYEPQRIHGFNFNEEPEDDEDEPIEKIKGCQF
jgi:hypothetical protein